jgi:threonine/homoserine/homoserine lactone efflux protein
MPTPGTLGAFTLATLALIAIPGPATFYLLSRGITSGRRRALLSALGVESGTVVFVVLTAFGLSALIASTTYAFTALHYLGAAYLLFLAWRAWRGAGDDGDGAPVVAAAPSSGWSAYRQGLLVGISNPKVAIFFLAFFPQFVDAGRGSAMVQVLVLGAVFAALGLTADVVNCCASSAIGGWLARHPSFIRVRRRVEAMSYAGLGAWTLVSGAGDRSK